MARIGTRNLAPMSHCYTPQDSAPSPPPLSSSDSSSSSSASAATAFDATPAVYAARTNSSSAHSDSISCGAEVTEPIDPFGVQRFVVELKSLRVPANTRIRHSVYVKFVQQLKTMPATTSELRYSSNKYSHTNHKYGCH